MERIDQQKLDELDKLKDDDIEEYYLRLEEMGEKMVNESYNNPPLKNRKESKDTLILTKLMFENFNGFGSKEEITEIAKKYKRVIDSEIEKFFKVNGKIYHRKSERILIPVETWFEEDEKKYEKKKGAYWWENQ